MADQYTIEAPAQSSGYTVEPPPPAAPPINANPQNEGLYDMQGPKGTEKIPYSKVPDALQNGYKLASSSLAQYAKDRQAQVNPGPGFHPLDALAAWGAKKAPHITPADADAQPEGSAPRILQNFGNTTFRDLTALPAGAVDAVKNASWTPAQFQAKQQSEIQGGTPVDAQHPLKDPTAADASDYAADTAAGAATGLLVGEAGGALLKGAGKVGKLVGPSTRTVADLVEKTRAENEVAANDTAEDNARQAAKDKQAKQDVLRANKDATAAHAAKKADVDAANAEALRQQQKIAPTQEKLQSATEEMRAREETARNNALKVGNEKYNGVNKELSNIPGDEKSLKEASAKASHSFGEVQNKPALLKRIDEVIGKDDNLITYKDEQLLYSELGNAISKGGLDGATFHAYDIMHEAIGKDMQAIADAKGKGAELLDARNYWRRMKQTFGKPLTMTDNATAAVRGANAEFMAADAQANRLRLLGSFDPEIPKVAAHIDNLKQGIAALPKEAPVRDVVKVPPPKPNATPIPKATPPKVAPVKTIVPEEIQGANKAGVKKTAQWMRSHAVNAAVYVSLYRPLLEMGRAMSGEGFSGLGQIPGDLGAGAVAYGGMRGIADVLEKPEVMKFLTKPTPAQLEAIPDELRGSMPQIVKAAQAKGIAISPSILALAVASGPKTRQLKSMKKYKHTAVGKDGHVIGSNDGSNWVDSETGEPIANQ